jgi:DNA-binding SARP family transcriptional activator
MSQGNGPGRDGGLGSRLPSPASSGSRRMRRPSLALLDGFAVSWRGEDVTLPSGACRLLACLALRRPGSRVQLAEMLWPGSDEVHAFGALRTAIWRIQRAAPDLLQTTATAVSLHPSADIDVRALASIARQLLVQPAGVTPVDVGRLRTAGELLPGWYDDWVLTERESLLQLRLHALECAAQEMSLRGLHGLAVDAAVAAAELDPLRESAHAIRVQVHMAEGNAIDALRTYHRYADLLDAELGLRPTDRFTDLVRPVMSAVRRAPRDDATTAYLTPPGRGRTLERSQ